MFVKITMMEMSHTSKDVWAHLAFLQKAQTIFYRESFLKNLNDEDGENNLQPHSTRLAKYSDHRFR